MAPSPQVGYGSLGGDMDSITPERPTPMSKTQKTLKLIGAAAGFTVFAAMAVLSFTAAVQQSTTSFDAPRRSLNVREQTIGMSHEYITQMAEQDGGIGDCGCMGVCRPKEETMDAQGNIVFPNQEFGECRVPAWSVNGAGTQMGVDSDGNPMEQIRTAPTPGNPTGEWGQCLGFDRSPAYQEQEHVPTAAVPNPPPALVLSLRSDRGRVRLLDGVLQRKRLLYRW